MPNAVTLTLVEPSLATNVWTPSESVAPTGTSLISSDNVSLPSVSVSDELMVKAADCVSSSTVTDDGNGQVGLIGDRLDHHVDRVHVLRLMGICRLLPTVAVTVNVKSTSLSAGGVTRSWLKCPARSHPRSCCRSKR